MALFIKRIKDKKIFKVRKYILSDDLKEESIWVNEWYGRHVIGKDCQFVNILPDSEIIFGTC